MKINQQPNAFTAPGHQEKAARDAAEYTQSTNATAALTRLRDSAENKQDIADILVLFAVVHPPFAP